MKNCNEAKGQEAFAVRSVLDPVAVDWKAVASQRLSRLVEIEHKHTLLVNRHEALQVDYRESVGDDEARLRRIRTLEHQRDRGVHEITVLQARLNALSEAQAALLCSRSWRVTKPMRAIARWLRNPRRAAKNGLLLLARPAPVRRAMKAVLGSVPHLRARVAAFMYSGSR